MEQSLKILEAALNAANKAGVFNLQESAAIFQAFSQVKSQVEIDTKKENVVESSKK